jgi:hypothetical protein
MTVNEVMAMNMPELLRLKESVRRELTAEEKRHAKEVNRLSLELCVINKRELELLTK